MRRGQADPRRRLLARGRWLLLLGLQGLDTSRDAIRATIRALQGAPPALTMKAAAGRAAAPWLEERGAL
jgi:hypothetical protein